MHWIDKSINSVIWLIKRANSFDHQSGANYCFKYYWELSLLKKGWGALIAGSSIILSMHCSKKGPNNSKSTKIPKFLNHNTIIWSNQQIHIKQYYISMVSMYFLFLILKSEMSKITPKGAEQYCSKAFLSFG